MTSKTLLNFKLYWTNCSVLMVTSICITGSPIFSVRMPQSLTQEGLGCDLKKIAPNPHKENKQKKNPAKFTRQQLFLIHLMFAITKRCNINVE